MILRLSLAAAIVVLSLPPAGAEPLTRGSSTFSAATTLSIAYMQHVACMAERTGMSLQTVAEMTWQQAALANKGFKHAHRKNIINALRLGRDDTLIDAQRFLQQAYRGMDTAAQVRTCTRAAARFLDAVSAGARLVEPPIPLPPIRPKLEGDRVSALSL